MLDNHEEVPAKVRTLDTILNIEDHHFTGPVSVNDRIQIVAKSAIDLVVAGFPMLDEPTWRVLLDVLRSIDVHFCTAFSRSTELPDRNFLAAAVTRKFSSSQLYQRFARLSDIKRLDRLERLAVCLAADHYWSSDTRSLRKTLCALSGRPSESVCAGDLSPIDLWRVQGASLLSENVAQIELCYAGEVKSVCIISRRPDRSNDVPVPRIPGRPLCLPHENLEQILTAKATTAARELFGS